MGSPGIESHHLSLSMHARVCAACPLDTQTLPSEAENSPFQCLLNGLSVILGLKAVVSGTIVLNQHGQSTKLFQPGMSAFPSIKTH